MLGASKNATRWTGVKIPELLAIDIDAYLTSDDAKRNGIFSRADYITRLVAADLAARKDKELSLKGSQRAMEHG